MGKASMGIVINLFETIHGLNLYSRICRFSTLNETIYETINCVALQGSWRGEGVTPPGASASSSPPSHQHCTRALLFKRGVVHCSVWLVVERNLPEL
jgi:hypothetical protein